MKRLLVVLVLALIATAVAAAPAWAGGPFAPLHGAVIHHASPAPAAVPVHVSAASATRYGHVPRAGTLGWTAVQTADAQVTRIYGRGVLVPRAAQGSIGAGIVAALLFIGAAVYAIVAGGRRPLAAASASKPVWVGGHRAAGRERRAA
jgi:hypothetical protein